MDGFTVSNANRFLDTGRIQVGGNSNSEITSPNIGSADSTQKSFADTLNEAIGSVNSLAKESDKAIQNLATGRTDDIASVMIASEKADIALKLMVQVRNKIIDAYQEVMKMQV
jgi:flagellar hook-basal body complex protein FliE